MSTNLCERAEDIVTYLYNEATLDEAKDFEQHMQHCSSCRSELASFGVVRDAVGEWRLQALGSFTPSAVAADAARRFASVVAPAQRRSAIIALREFLTLSPTWLRAATAFAVLAFCALAAVAVAYFVRQPQTIVVEKQGQPGYSAKEVEAKIADALRKQNEANEARVKEMSVPSPETVKIANNEQFKNQTQIKRGANAAPQLAKNTRRPQVVAPRTVTRQSKMELASTEFLPFTAPKDEEKLPSLADLVDDDN